MKQEKLKVTASLSQKRKKKILLQPCDLLTTLKYLHHCPVAPVFAPLPVILSFFALHS
jgi:hypothetical protein